MKSLRQLIGGGCLEFASFEPTCTAVFIASDQTLKFTSDSENSIVEENEEPKGEPTKSHGLN